jgi:hypothetical protein
VKREESDGAHREEHDEKKDGDEPSYSISSLWGWLGDAKGIDEGIREEKQWSHGC